MSREPAKFHVLAMSQYFEPGFKAGGPIRSVARIVDTIPQEVKLTLVTSDRDLGDPAPYSGLSGARIQRGPATVHYVDAANRRQRQVLADRLREGNFDLLYVNSLFNPRFSIMPVLAARTGGITASKILIAPRGELSQGALSLKSGKKAAFLKIWLRFLHGLDVTWHATSQLEAADIRSVWPNSRIEVCHDQGDLPSECLCAIRPQDTPRLLFLSRISRMKNLDLALTALQGIDCRVELDIYGPVEDEPYWRRCQDIIATLPPAVRATYRGALPYTAVRSTMAGYDALVLPTLGENFGHVIAESLSASCPVICSDQTSWTQVLQGGGGAVAKLTIESFRKAVENTVNATVDQRWEAKRAAGAAYMRWKSKADSRNIIAHVLGLA
ncbi:glycosyltransferase involved in cell wall biosynthesis [Krasilnikovia cinnamomea]|uniref:Glycosyltransferase involved in cell wall biosynthesis n=1 Tax=Krasilnikovia cinnamomea TaxID=349313 RepID=A0A4Q7ZIQ6_9ACTN|nr:glycosyltransferase [Krasilnikovia cinnamomea]RZU50153.1 glycosyltransferase involved in cell wall biosynthesis [Krasilnikovia cinnamomea]